MRPHRPVLRQVARPPETRSTSIPGLWTFRSDAWLGRSGRVRRSRRPSHVLCMTASTYRFLPQAVASSYPPAAEQTMHRAVAHHRHCAEARSASSSILVNPIVDTLVCRCSGWLMNPIARAMQCRMFGSECFGLVGDSAGIARMLVRTAGVVSCPALPDAAESGAYRFIDAPLRFMKRVKSSLLLN